MLGIFKSILLTLLSPLRWFFNYFCKRRFRKLTYSKSEENLAPSCDVNNSRDHTVLDFDQQQSWNNDWNSEEDEKAAKIEQYRRQLAAASNKEDEIQGAEDVNFFADMEPQNVRQPKVFVGQQNKSDSKSRLSISIDDPSLSCPPVDTGLQDWGESNANAGWDAEEEDVTDILREHRRMRKMNAPVQ